MTVTLKLGARQLTLGIVSGIGFTHADRAGDIDLPGARGTGKQVLGKASMQISLEGTLSGVSRFSDFKQFERIRMLGRSLKLESPELDTIAFLEEASLRNSAWADHLDYSLSLKESLFKQINACDELTGWGEDGWGTLSLEDTEPEPREGDYLVTDTVVDADSHYLYYYPPDELDLTNYDYLAFDAILSDVTHLTSIIIDVIDDNGVAAEHDLTAEMSEGDAWRRILLQKNEFTELGGVFDWSRVKMFWFTTVYSQNGSYVLGVDDLGAHE